MTRFEKYSELQKEYGNKGQNVQDKLKQYQRIFLIIEESRLAYERITELQKEWFNLIEKQSLKILNDLEISIEEEGEKK